MTPRAPVLSDPFDPSRRRVLKQAGLVAVGLAATPLPGFPLGWFQDGESVIPFTDVPDSFTTQRSNNPERYPGQNLVAQDLRELTDWITPIEDYFALPHYGYVELDAATYRLQLTGLVDHPVTLTLDQLKQRPRVERTFAFECAGNPPGPQRMNGMVGNATWAGADLNALLEEAGLQVNARDVHFWGADTGTETIRGEEYQQHFARSMSPEDVMETTPVLAYEMNGKPLPVVHGFPVRLVVPGWYGVCQVKWLERVEIAESRLMTRFMARDYVTIIGRERDGQTDWIETAVSRQRIKSMVARVTRSGQRMTVFGNRVWRWHTVREDRGQNR